MTYDEIQELNGIQPYGFESNREEQWYERGLVEGADVAYKQAEQDLMEKAKQWFTEYVSVHFELETNEDGEPLADSYIQYAKAKLDAANETFENFKQFITEN